MGASARRGVRQCRLLWCDGSAVAGTEPNVAQGVIAFASQENAARSWVAQRGQWGMCGGKTITVSAPGQPDQFWQFAQPVTAAGVLTIAAALQAANTTCQHGILMRGNVVIDLPQCRVNGGANVAALVSATGVKVPQQ